MKHAKHSKPAPRRPDSAGPLAALVASSAARHRRPGRRGKSACGSHQPAESRPHPSRRSPATGPSYGPVLHPQPPNPNPAPSPNRPRRPRKKRPARAAGRRAGPRSVGAPGAPAERSGQGGHQKGRRRKGGNRSARRSAPQRVATVPRRSEPAAAAGRLPPAQPLPVVAGPVQINSCLGGTCSDTGGRHLQHRRRQRGREQPGAPVHPHRQHDAMLLSSAETARGRWFAFAFKAIWFFPPKVRYNPAG
jgi:hypothetical protein